NLARFADAHLLALRSAAEKAGQHVLDVDSHLLDALRREDLEGGVVLLLDINLDLALFQLALVKPSPEFLACVAGLLDRPAGADEGRAGGGAARVREEDVENALARVADCGIAVEPRFLIAHQLDADLGEIADDRLHIASDVSDLGELRGLDFEEWRTRQARQTPRDLSLSHAGRTDHDDVLRRDLVAQLGLELLPPPAVAEGNRHRALGGVLP